MADQPDSPSSDAQGYNPTPVNIGGASLADRVLPHLKTILLAAGAGMVLITGFYTWKWWQLRAAHKQSKVVMAALSTAEAPVAAEPPAADDGARQAFPSATARAEAALSTLREAEGGPRGTVAMVEARLLLEAGKLDEAERAYRRLSGRAGLDGVLAREGLGYVAEARAVALQGEAYTAALGAALEAFRAAQPADDGVRRDWTLYHEGRLLAAMGQKEEARKALESAREKAGDELRATVELRLNQLDAPAVPMPPPGSAAPAGDAPAAAPAGAAPAGDAPAAAPAGEAKGTP